MRILVRLVLNESFRNNLEIQCHPICNRLYEGDPEERYMIEMYERDVWKRYMRYVRGIYERDVWERYMRKIRDRDVWER